VADDGGALLGPVVDPLRLGDGHVDASVRAGVAEAGAPRRPVEGVARVEVGHPGHVLGHVGRAVGVLPLHRLNAVLEVDVVGARDGRRRRGAVDDADRAVDDRGALVGGDGLVGQVDVDPLLPGGRLVDEVLRPIRNGLVLPGGLDDLGLEGSRVGGARAQRPDDRGGQGVHIGDLRAVDRLDLDAHDGAAGVDVALAVDGLLGDLLALGLDPGGDLGGVHRERGDDALSAGHRDPGGLGGVVGGEGVLAVGRLDRDVLLDPVVGLVGHGPGLGFGDRGGLRDVVQRDALGPEGGGGPPTLLVPDLPGLLNPWSAADPAVTTQRTWPAPPTIRLADNPGTLRFLLDVRPRRSVHVRCVDTDRH